MKRLLILVLVIPVLPGCALLAGSDTVQQAVKKAGPLVDKYCQESFAFRDGVIRPQVDEATRPHQIRIYCHGDTQR